eukprot:gnl/Chilomastix_caulleri/8396.p1 GENE.gnl/Chilomastix_caulleri/8396~~gnl/Chilomastix_caulleri/8396.p1  ORF type:complete len:63 (+),score=9.31 gnl/Chilomastix_caulleri/8396:186-374(+)
MSHLCLWILNIITIQSYVLAICGFNKQKYLTNSITTIIIEITNMATDIPLQSKTGYNQIFVV